MKPARILLFDFETTSLKADFGFLLCAGYKFLGEKTTHVISIGDFSSHNFRNREKELVKRFLEVYLSADMVVGHNIQRYDVPWLNAKCLEHGLPVPPPLPQIDTLQIARYHLRAVSRKRLDTLSYYLGTSEEKSPVEGRLWVNAALGDKKALAYVKLHCRKDVDVLEEVYLKLRPLFGGHPRVAGYDGCRHCGSLRLERRGLAYSSAKGQQVRLRCKDCGAWEQRPAREAACFESAAANFARRNSGAVEAKRPNRRRGTDGKPNPPNRQSRNQTRRPKPVAGRNRRVGRR